MTALADALRASRVDTAGARLHVMAVDALRAAGGRPSAALNAFVTQLLAEGGPLGRLMVGDEAVARAARNYLENVARDMRGDGIGSKEPGGGHRNRAYNMGLLARASTEIDDDAASRREPSFGHHNVAASSSSERATGAARRMTSESSNRIPPSSRSPSAPRGASSLQALRRVTTIYDSIVLRDGTPIGDLRYSQLDRFIATNAQEAALLRMVRDHGVPADRNARIRDLVTVEMLQRFVQRAALAAERAAAHD